jgi:hypothetical protein
MTQPGKRRRDGVVDTPDFDGLYAGQKAVKKRRRGVVRPPSLEELQVPEHHAVLAGNVGGSGACDGNNNNQNVNSPVFDEGEGEITNGDERVKEETTRWALFTGVDYFDAVYVHVDIKFDLSCKC